MKTLMAVALTITSFAFSPSLRAAVIWDESKSGDLPASFGILYPGDNYVFGRVGIPQGSNPPFDWDDWFTFQIPAGLSLERMVVSTSSPDYLAFGLDRGTVVDGDTVEFRLADSRAGTFDLLQFDSAPGPQPGGTYIFSVDHNPGTSAFEYYTLDFVVSTPESSTVLFGGLCIVSLGFFRSRRSQPSDALPV